MDRMRLYDRLSQLSMLGNGTVPGIPLVEIIADKRVLIENHQGVCCYSHEQICVKTSLGPVRIDGQCLHLKKMSKEQLTIVGKIEGVHICRGERNGD